MIDQDLITAVAAGVVQAMSQSPIQQIGNRRPQRRERSMTVGTQATPFGCCDFFDRCGDGDLMSLHFSGELPLLDWMGFNVSDICYRTMEFISFVRPAYYQGTPTAGYLSDPCEDPHGIEYGSCKLTVEDFGRIGRLGPTRDIMKPKKYCINDPVWRLDGTKVNDEREWDMKFVMDTIINDINELMVTGNAGVSGQFDGLQRWVRTGYDCSNLDSIVIDWNGNAMSGGAGMTWNGAPIAATYNFIDVLLAGYRRIIQRKSWSPRLRTQRINAGDMILVMPHSMIPCLLAHFTCWSVCDGSQYNEVALQSYEARAFYQGLLGGAFGNGQITLDGQIIPILGYDWNLINGPTTGDIYFLSGAFGATRIWEGEHLSASVAVNENPDQGYFQTDGGRALWRVDTENECRTMKGWIHPRLFCKAPWAQIRFQDVQCNTPGGFLSANPNDTSFYPLTSFSQADCP